MRFVDNFNHSQIFSLSVATRVVPLLNDIFPWFLTLEMKRHHALPCL